MSRAAAMGPRYFGPPWPTPAFAIGEQVPTPVGLECLYCGEAIADGDTGWLRASIGGYCQPVHVECELLGIIGHDYGVCSCTGYDTRSRAAALELGRRITAQWPQ